MNSHADGLLLDTNVCIPHLRGRLDVFGLTTPEQKLFLPVTALGELLHGVLKSPRAAQERRSLDQFQTKLLTLYPTDDTAEWYAKIAVQLEAKGRMIPQNDLWIAALALEHELPLATRDAHFEQVEGLTVIRW